MSTDTDDTYTFAEVRQLAKTQPAHARRVIDEGRVKPSPEEAARHGLDPATGKRPATLSSRMAAEASNLPPQWRTPQAREQIAEAAAEMTSRRAKRENDAREAAAETRSRAEASAHARIEARRQGTTPEVASALAGFSQRQSMPTAEFYKFSKLDVAAAKRWLASGGVVETKHV